MAIKKALVVGHGSIGIRHLTMFNTVFDYNIDIAVLRRKTTEPFQFAKYFFDTASAKNWNPDFVIIASPSFTHANYISEFNDKHLLVEKPAVTSEKHLDVILQHNKEKLLQVGYNYRYHPEFIRLKNYLSENNIKKLKLEHSDYLPNWHPWEDYRLSDVAKDGVGLTLCHGYDILFELFGKELLSKASIHRQTNLDIHKNTMNLGEAQLEKCLVNWEISCDNPNKHVFKIETTGYDNVKEVFDFNDLKYTRNDTFINQLKDVKRKIYAEFDYEKQTKKEYERAKEIITICKL